MYAAAFPSGRWGDYAAPVDRCRPFPIGLRPMPVLWTFTAAVPAPVVLTSVVLAQAEELAPRGYAVSWAVVLLSVILGLVVALRPVKREDKAPKPRK